jgi:hypothetical protein
VILAKNIKFLLIVFGSIFLVQCNKLEGCTDDTACNYNLDATDDDGSCEFAQPEYDCNGNIIIELYLGMEAFGGVVFYIDNTGQNGWVAALEDLSGMYEWGCLGLEVGNFSTGLENTLNIINQGCLPESNGLTASQACFDFTDGLYNDWYLPSIGELQLLNSANDAGIIIMYDDYYWSSSETNIDYSKCIHFGMGGGEEYSYLKSSTYAVRPIRSF